MRLTDQFPRPTAGGPRCYVCSGPGVKPLLDTGIVIEMEGRLVICAKCVKRAGKLIGLVEPKEADALRAQNERLEAENARLAGQIKGLEDVQLAIVTAYEALPA